MVNRSSLIRGCQDQIDQLNRMINVSDDEYMKQVFRDNIADREAEIAEINAMSDEELKEKYKEPELIIPEEEKE